MPASHNTPTEKSLLTAQIKLIVAIILWGGSFIATKVVLRELSAVTLVWSRFLVGIFISFPLQPVISEQHTHKQCKENRECYG